MLRLPLWLVGFRPFFILACLAGLSLPLWWALIYTGAVPPAPTFAVSPLQWHAHEMFYGFGWAGLGGFLLTATKNWVGVRGWHGPALIALVAAWLFDRVAMDFGAGWPPALFWLANSLFMAACIAMVMTTLLHHRAKDSFDDNHFLLLALPLFLPAKWLLTQGDYFALGWGMTLALFRVAFLVMLERTLTQFMRGLFRVEILRHRGLDHAIKWLALLLVFEAALPAPLAGVLDFLLAALLGYRFARWYPRQAFSRLDIGIMYVGYLAIVLQLCLAGYGHFTEPAWVGAISVHVFTFGAMGVVIPAMIVRIAQGHTGRPVVFLTLDKIVLWIMLAALVVRVLLPQLYPAAYMGWLHLAATCWLVAYGLLLWRFLPMLVSARVDGKEH
jgi:uncharacterized protein involved in response to NO